MLVYVAEDVTNFFLENALKHLHCASASAVGPMGRFKALKAHIHRVSLRTGTLH